MANRLLWSEQLAVRFIVPVPAPQRTVGFFKVYFFNPQPFYVPVAKDDIQSAPVTSLSGLVIVTA